MRRAPDHALAPGDPALAPDPDLARALALLASFEPADESQARERDRIARFVRAHPRDAHRRSCLAGHLTASALLLDDAGERALCTLHKKLGRWLQLGGHADGDANLVACALRECREESGIDALVIDPRPIDVDVHAIPARPGEPAHLHLDVRFLVWAAPGAQPVCSDESHELRWFTRDELAAAGTDESVLRLFDRARAPR